MKPEPEVKPMSESGVDSPPKITSKAPSKPQVEAEGVKPCELPCPKCGSLEVNRQFRYQGETWTVREKRQETASSFINIAGDYYREATRDCITHHCRTCQHDWQTKPLKK